MADRKINYYDISRGLKRFSEALKYLLKYCRKEALATGFISDFEAVMIRVPQ